MDHIASVRKHYPSYTICCLTNRLMSFINKREQQKYKQQKVASDWIRPPVEKLFAKLTTQFSNVHIRQCVDEAEVAEHVVGLTINLAKCHSRKKLTHLSVNANGCNVTKDCLYRSAIKKDSCC
ncbi:crossover junction endonuclease EME1B-like [Chenopodium quinoa]|nr:crossover junction endonuclease EME1B-like [Chenopodium quinoa]